MPREAFVAPDQARPAYDDRPLPIGAGQTISQPYIVALMIDAAEIGPGDRVLEVGAGSGYAAAVLGQVAGAGDRDRAPRRRWRSRRRSGSGGSAMPMCGSSRATAASAAPPTPRSMRSWSSAGGPHVPDQLIEQLKPGGRLVMPVGGSRYFQTLIKLTKHDDGRIEREQLAAVRFVPSDQRLNPVRNRNQS